MSNSERASLTLLACVAIWTFIGLPIIYMPAAEHSEGIKPGEWLVGGATVALFAATLALWWATRSLVLGAEDTAVRQLRAYITVESLTYSIRDQNRIVSHLVFKNTGQTPATDVRSHLRFGVARDGNVVGELPPLPELEYGSSTMMGTGQVNHNIAEIAGVAESADSILARVAMGQYALIAYGKITYTDIFGLERVTHFRYHRDNRSKTGTNELTSSWTDNWIS